MRLGSEICRLGLVLGVRGVFETWRLSSVESTDVRVITVPLASAQFTSRSRWKTGETATASLHPMGYGLSSRDARGSCCWFGQKLGAYVIHFGRFAALAHFRVSGGVVNGDPRRDHALVNPRCHQDIC